MSYRFNVVMNEQLISAKIKQGILRGTVDTVKETKTQLSATQNNPNVYENRGGALSQMLTLTGLDKYTISNKLRTAWLAQIESIKTKYLQDTLIINMFNSLPLDEGTKWIGLKYSPKFQKSDKGVGTDADKWRALDRTRGFQTRSGKLIQKLGGYVVDGFRPLPNGSGRGFTWATNPYKGRGYWFLYHQGYIGSRGGGINYVPHKFIFGAYYFIFGNNVARMLGTGKDLKLTETYRKLWGYNIAKRVNMELRK